MRPREKERKKDTQSKARCARSLHRVYEVVLSKSVLSNYESQREESPDTPPHRKYANRVPCRMVLSLGFGTTFACRLIHSTLHCNCVLCIHVDLYCLL